MKEETNKASFSKFLKEYAENDLTPPVALNSLYGGWNDSAGFIPKDYSRYSPEAREEVVKAALLGKDIAPSHEDDKVIELVNTCSGLLFVDLRKPMPKDRKPKVLKELDLWKKWGVSRDCINKWIAFTVESQVCLKGITEIYPKVLKAIIKYADVHISQEIFNNLSEKVGETELDVRSQAVFDLLKERVR